MPFISPKKIVYVRMPLTLYCVMKRWAKGWHLPLCHIMRRLVELVPWYDNSRTTYCLAVRNVDRKKRERLQAALNEAVELIMQTEFPEEP